MHELEYHPVTLGGVLNEVLTPILTLSVHYAAQSGAGLGQFPSLRFTFSEFILLPA
jgi:hypothetical protein